MPFSSVHYLIQRILILSQGLNFGSSSIKKYDIEPLPTAYLIIGEGTTAWYIGDARGIPFNKEGIAVMYSLAHIFRNEIFIS